MRWAEFYDKEHGTRTALAPRFLADDSYSNAMWDLRFEGCDSSPECPSQYHMFGCPADLDETAQ